mmetsp:Transcript_12273/g.29971  ORF Transcript_12273/g.29971 Transcript_12273/m.29971 type:complete len:267 (+) Transcript_12273:721-1521(+)
MHLCYSKLLCTTWHLALPALPSTAAACAPACTSLHHARLIRVEPQEPRGHRTRSTPPSHLVPVVSRPRRHTSGDSCATMASMLHTTLVLPPSLSACARLRPARSRSRPSCRSSCLSSSVRAATSASLPAPAGWDRPACTAARSISYAAHRASICATSIRSFAQRAATSAARLLAASCCCSSSSCDDVLDALSPLLLCLLLPLSLGWCAGLRAGGSSTSWPSLYTVMPLPSQLVHILSSLRWLYSSLCTPDPWQMGHMRASTLEPFL